jgi:hypothetical protein
VSRGLEAQNSVSQNSVVDMVRPVHAGKSDWSQSEAQSRGQNDTQHNSTEV